MNDVTLTVLKDGPILVSGATQLKDAAGGDLDTGGRDSYALCRCGASGNKPFCDGSHKGCGFRDDS